MKKLLIFKFDVSKLFFVLRKLNLKSPFFSFYLSHRMSSLEEEKTKCNSHDWFLVQKYRYILKMKKPLCYCILIWIMIPIECVCQSEYIWERETKLAMFLPWHNHWFKCVMCDLCSLLLSARLEHSLCLLLISGSFRYSCDICGKKYKYYSCFQEHRDLHAVDGNYIYLFILNVAHLKLKEFIRKL